MNNGESWICDRWRTVPGRLRSLLVTSEKFFSTMPKRDDGSTWPRRPTQRGAETSGVEKKGRDDGQQCDALRNGQIDARSSYREGWRADERSQGREIIRYLSGLRGRHVACV